MDEGTKVNDGDAGLKTNEVIPLADASDNVADETGLKSSEIVPVARDGEIAPVAAENKGNGIVQDSDAPLFRKDKAAELDKDWQQVQVSFVDEPRASVEKADALVKKTIDSLAASFSDMRASLETSWEQDKEVSTEDLRMALQSYRSFFKRLLSI